MAAQEDSGSSSHHYTIDIQPGPNCAVCMEPLEWVAVAPCGHREVCAACAARIRFFENDRRCCICRSPCPTVFVTRASRAGQRAFLWPPPPAFGGEGRVLKFYWYHRGMASYFDDLC
ncbi:hypothetical protein C2845_PM03G32840 [Panicum miliaceum]|uniref:RING-type domain-containing protein n=1 Tax=Panicum miliaceum TaxID=4540 RepID=A0A3L6T4V0_PANMI|nr:hypothetical protein C2845_PM03G32840 [Panicum miliaceum]